MATPFHHDLPNHTGIPTSTDQKAPNLPNVLSCPHAENIASPLDTHLNEVAQQLPPRPPLPPQLRHRARHRFRQVIYDGPHVEAMSPDHRNFLDPTERRTKEDQSSIRKNQFVGGPYVVNTFDNHQHTPFYVQYQFRHWARGRSQASIHEGPRATIPHKGHEPISSDPACGVSSHGGHAKETEHFPLQHEEKEDDSCAKTCDNYEHAPMYNWVETQSHRSERNGQQDVDKYGSHQHTEPSLDPSREEAESDVACTPKARVSKAGEEENNDLEVICINRVREQNPGASKHMYEQPRAVEDYFGIGEQQQQRGSSGLDDCLRCAMSPDTEFSSQDVGNSLECNSHADIPSVEEHNNCHQGTTVSEGLSLPQQIDEWQHLQHASEDYIECMQQHHIHVLETSLSLNARSSAQKQQGLSENHVSDSNHLHVPQNYRHDNKEVDDHSQHTHCHVTKSAIDVKSHEEQTHEYRYDYSQVGVVLDDRPSEQQHTDDQSKEEDKACADDSDDIPTCKEGCSQDEGLLPSLDVEIPPLFLGFNQGTTHFVCGSSRGFRVYDTATMKERVRSMLGGVSIVEFHSSDDILFLVGGGPKPSFPPNKVVAWNAVKGRPCGELVHKSPIKAVKARRDRIVVVADNEIFIYNHADGRLLFQISTTTNTKGLCAISTKEGPSILACPGLKRGEVRVEHIGMNRGLKKLPTRNSIVFTAHDSGLACMALTHDGSFLATASDRGTLIRVFNAIYGSPIQELRRGADRAEIYSVAFSPSADWLAVSSDKGTIHVFCLNVTSSKRTESNSTSPATSIVVRNPGSTFSFIKGVLPKYFSSEWSYAQFKLSEEMKSIVAFGQQEQKILILGMNGRFFKCSFDPAHGGDMRQLECVNFMKPIESIC